MPYVIVVEPTVRGFSAYVAELPGCIATARTEKEVRKLITKSIALHLTGMGEDREPIPLPRDTR